MAALFCIELLFDVFFLYSSALAINTTTSDATAMARVACALVLSRRGSREA